MILINILFIVIIVLIIIDIYLLIKPKSKLEMIGKNLLVGIYDGVQLIDFELEISNKSNKKETMIPNLNFVLDAVHQENFDKYEYETEIIIDDYSKKKYLRNYWETIILRAKSKILLRVKIKFKDKLSENINFLWLKVNWENYGDFGLVKKQNCFLINKQDYKERELIDIQLNERIKAIAIKTDLLGSFNDPIMTVVNYCEDIIQNEDILVIGETPLAIMQGRYLSPINLQFTIFSKILCYFFHPTSSLATACGMQLLINKIGVTRISLSLLIGFIFKCFGIKGVFYILAGEESSLIDDISGTTPPYDKTIVMGPKNPMKFCNELSKKLKINIAVVDVNDLGGVKILACSKKSIANVLQKVLVSNPAGNDDQRTPILLIRGEKIKEKI